MGGCDRWWGYYRVWVCLRVRRVNTGRANTGIEMGCVACGPPGCGAAPNGFRYCCAYRSVIARNASREIAGLGNGVVTIRRTLLPSCT